MSIVQQKDINKAAWDACDTFRGVLDPAPVQRLHPGHAFREIHLRHME